MKRKCNVLEIDAKLSEIINDGGGKIPSIRVKDLFPGNMEFS